jgi:hypothetical protein
MKILPLLSASVLLCPSAAFSAVLIGFYDFTNGAENETHDVAATHFSATVVKGTQSRDIGGSNDSFYGDSSLTVPVVAAGDGALRIISTLVINVTYSSDAILPVQLENLYFDATYTTSTNGLVVSYKVNNGTSVPLDPNPFGSAPAGITDSGDTPQAYNDYSRSLSAVILNPGDTLAITFTTSSARLDNIALTGTAIPEPSVTLGVASGMILIVRRNRTACRMS